MIRIYLIGILMGALLQATAQPTPVLTTEKSKLLIGEPFRLTLELKAIDRNAAVRWIIPDTLEHFEWLEKDTTGLLKRTYILTSWDSGVWKLSGFQVIVPSSVDGTPLTLTFPVTELKVEHDTSGSNLLHDIKPIIEVNDAGERWIGYLVTASVAGSLLGLWWLFRRRRRLMAHVSEPTAPVSSYEELCAVISELQKTNWGQPELQKQALSRLRTSFQSYMQRATGKPLSTSTTDQLGVQLQQHLQRSQLMELIQLYRLTDAVLFARFQAAATDCEAALHTISSVAETIQKGGEA